jgi:phosphoribosylamine--glycine ligase
MFRVLVIGSGAREHAIVWALRHSALQPQLFCAPGNGGIAAEAQCVEIASDDVAGLLAFARRQAVDLTVVGPELPLALGLVDHFEQGGLKVIGPHQAAARLESSKVFAKQFMARYRIPSASFQVVDDPRAARALLAGAALHYPLVVKADGLAAGKGVVVAGDRNEAEEAVSAFMERRTLGAAGEKLVFEEFLPGEEASYILICDGATYLPLASSQDHKRVFDQDRGPNTGGMGAYSPTPVLTAPLERAVRERIVEPTLEGLLREQLGFCGFLYVGLMLTAAGPQVLEFNVRLGDPETQAILPRLETDLLELLQAARAGRLVEARPRWHAGSAACVVLASGGYPGPYRKGLPISGLEQAAELEDVTLFHAGTLRTAQGYVTSGGRVLVVAGRGANLPRALERAYAGARLIQFEGCHYRSDIGARGVAREQSQ